MSQTARERRVRASDAQPPDNLSSLRHLREKIATQIDSPKVKSARNGSNSMQSTASPRSTMQSVKEQPIGGLADEDYIKRRQNAVKNLARDVEIQLEAIQKLVGRARQTIEELAHSARILKNQQALTMARIDQRTKKPSQEQVQDAFQEALVAEREFLRDAIQKVNAHVSKGPAVLEPVEAVIAEIIAVRLTLHMDRKGYTQELLNKSQDLEQKTIQYCRECQKDKRKIMDQMERTRASTNSTIKTVLNQMLSARLLMESEIKETIMILAEAQKQLARKEKEVARIKSNPEEMMKEGKPIPKQYETFNERHANIMKKLRAKIRGAAYTGTAGRRLDVLFMRFDKDKSGELDEDELRMAFRRTLKVPKDVITDADIHALCIMLDGDGSGSVSIREMVEFLGSDVNLESLEKECQSLREHVHQLNQAKDQIMEDMRSKTLAWQCDVAVSKLSLKLSLPSIAQKQQDQTPR